MKRVRGWAILCGMTGVLMLAGCASKDDQALYAKIRERAPELQTLQQSEKAVFRQGGERETVVLATYLPESDAYEEFVIAVYPNDQLSASAYRLDGVVPTLRKRISKAGLPERLRRTIPSWYTVYRLRFPHRDSKRFVLEIRDSEGVKKELVFYKGPKYLITKTKTKHF